MNKFIMTLAFIFAIKFNLIGQGIECAPWVLETLDGQHNIPSDKTDGNFYVHLLTKDKSLLCFCPLDNLDLGIYSLLVSILYFDFKMDLQFADKVRGACLC